MYLCICKGVRVSEAVDAVRSGARSPESLINRFGLRDAECCGRCARDTGRLNNLVNGELATADAVQGSMPYNGTGLRATMSI